MYSKYLIIYELFCDSQIGEKDKSPYFYFFYSLNLAYIVEGKIV